MDKILPQIEMPKAPEPEVVETLLPDSGDPSDKELIEKIQQQLLDDIPDDDDPLIQVTQRNIPEEDEVFGDPPTVKPLQDDNSQINSEYPPSAQQAMDEERKGKRKYTRKAPMSDKQKLHLEKIRAIAAEKRKEKKAEKELLKKQKEEEKEESRLKKAEQRILAKQRKEQEEINNSNQEPPSAPRGQPRNTPTPQMGFSREDMEKAMFSAISSYETIRKSEKEEKKKRQLAEARENKMRDTLHRAINPQAPPDPWRQFFA